ncbi:hypothetical protein [Leifsonia poae]|uniref:hypothetical protein n=1 Tax=Leifsonia poae TaxID=110933 RepID=UPI0027E0B68B|nr:hypothetical protein [Leifsonia poae]
MTPTTSAFALPDHLAAKLAPALIADDERHFSAIETSLARSIAELTAQREIERAAPPMKARRHWIATWRFTA